MKEDELQSILNYLLTMHEVTTKRSFKISCPMQCTTFIQKILYCEEYAAAPCSIHSSGIPVRPYSMLLYSFEV